MKKKIQSNNIYIKFKTIFDKFINSKTLFIIKSIIHYIIKILAFIIYQCCYKWKFIILGFALFGTYYIFNHKEMVYSFVNHETTKLIFFYKYHNILYFPLYFIVGLLLVFLLVFLCFTFRLKDLKQKKIRKIKDLRNGEKETPYFTHRARLWLNLRVAIWYLNMNGIEQSMFKSDLFKERFQSTFNRTYIDTEPLKNNESIIKIISTSPRYRVPSVIELNYNNLDSTSTKFLLGETIKGKVYIDIKKKPQTLIGGITGSGKSVLIDNLIYQSVIKGYTLRITDPKKTEFNRWNNLTIKESNWLTKNNNDIMQCKVSTTLKDSYEDLLEINQEMEKRAEYFAHYNCKNIDEYNKKFYSNFNCLKLSRIIYIFDEVVELSISKDKTYSKEIEEILTLIATRGRYLGIHLILATQRPDCKLLEGQIKSNLDNRICGRTADRILSEVVLGKGNYDADTLIGKEEVGLFVTNNKKRFRGYLLDTEKIVEELRKQQEKTKNYTFKISNNKEYINE